ncbi:alanine racemase [Klebsiella pneumoniae]|nr:alanine racemase [Klebsiella pneumoniae]
MKYHSAPLIPHKSALMSAPANLLAEEVCLPAALLKKSALENNISWMQRYADARGVSLAPHGKTTMTPWIFQAQQRAGAWGIGVGSAWQASAAMASGIQRVLMVNQLVGKANMQVVAQLKAHYRAVDFICCVDSEANVRTLSAFFAAQGQTLDVLIELGVPGGRCGCRSVDDALALAQRVSDLPGLRLRGLELYEGVLHGDDPQPQVEALLQQAAALIGDMTSAESLAWDNGAGGLPYGGELILALDPQRFLGAQAPEQLARAETLFMGMQEQGARLPGERRFACRQQSERQGVIISRSLHDEICALRQGG